MSLFTLISLEQRRECKMITLTQIEWSKDIHLCKQNVSLFTLISLEQRRKCKMIL